MQRIHHGFLVDPQNLAIRHGRGGAHAQKLARQGTFAKKIPLAHDRDGRFLAGLGYDGEPHFALLDIEDGVGLVPLRKDHLLFRHRQNLPAVADGREESVGVEFAVFLASTARLIM